MIKGFEEITKELNEKELELIPVLVKEFSKHSKTNPVKAPAIVKQINQYLEENNFGIRMSEPRLRKCCNHIRANSLLPLIATSAGYFVSLDKEIIDSQIKSLRQRAWSINNCADGLENIVIQSLGKGGQTTMF